MGIFSNWRRNKTEVIETVVSGLKQVSADQSRCVQCGICGYNCPVGIEVRDYAWRGLNVTDPRCISCGTCVERCPRGTLRWGDPIILQADRAQVIDPLALPVLDWGGD
ncbi:MAG: 4Fe-4S binding protein [Anaerolineales bacterium]|nr:4Fe-4S binding protein [Anaerolineales bacterium]MCB8959669.1 4Fe-4S binding protein [Ardenticatenales bacterium]